MGWRAERPVTCAGDQTGGGRSQETLFAPGSTSTFQRQEQALLVHSAVLGSPPPPRTSAVPPDAQPGIIPGIFPGLSAAAGQA